MWNGRFRWEIAINQAVEEKKKKKQKMTMILSESNLIDTTQKTSPQIHSIITFFFPLDSTAAVEKGRDGTGSLHPSLPLVHTEIWLAVGQWLTGVFNYRSVHSLASSWADKENTKLGIASL